MAVCPTPTVSSESSGDDLFENFVHVSKRKPSLLSKWKESGLALRRYLYCMEPKSSESSSVEEDDSFVQNLLPSSSKLSQNPNKKLTVSCNNRLENIDVVNIVSEKLCRNNYEHSELENLQFADDKFNMDAGTENEDKNSYIDRSKPSKSNVLYKINSVNISEEATEQCRCICRMNNVPSVGNNCLDNNDTASSYTSAAGEKACMGEDGIIKSEQFSCCHSNNGQYPNERVQERCPIVGHTCCFNTDKKDGKSCTCEKCTKGFVRTCIRDMENCIEASSDTCSSCLTFRNRDFFNHGVNQLKANCVKNVPFKVYGTKLNKDKTSQPTCSIDAKSIPNENVTCTCSDENMLPLMAENDVSASLLLLYDSKRLKHTNGDNFEITSSLFDSNSTDSSSVFDCVDASGELRNNDVENSLESVLRQRDTRSKSRMNSDRNDCNKIAFTSDTCIDYDIEGLETALENSPSGFLSSLARMRLDTHSSEASTESETVSTVNHACDDSSTTDSIPGLNYALPYLSDRLKSSLTKRVGLRDKPVSSGSSHWHSLDSIDQEHLSKYTDRLEHNTEDRECGSGVSSDSEERELLVREVSSGEYMTDERTFADLIFKQPYDRICSNPSNFDQIDNASDVNDAVSDGDEADDEFECDCHFCIEAKTGHTSSGCHGNNGDNSSRHGNWVTVGSGATDGNSEDDHFNFWSSERDHGNNLFTFNIEELSPFDFLVNDTRREIESMFENVILQMLAVHPDLLNDQAPPPASIATIESLTTISVTSHHTSQSLSCAICLCIYEEKESMSLLPCQHSFHLLCIQAWLNKSGTCPICRSVLQ